MSTVIVDYGTVNLSNILRALTYIGAKVTTSRDSEQILNADRLFLPGVGAFDAGMRELSGLGLIEAIREIALVGRPILGICLGMQMLFDSSTEHGFHSGLGLISGSVIPIPTDERGIRKRKTPHIGWSALRYPSYGLNWSNTCLDQTASAAFCYFVHSFMVKPNDGDIVLAECVYQELPIVAAVKKNNITGLQFHPERSGPTGLNILTRFIES